MYMVKEVDAYWRFKTPTTKLTEPVLRTKECCHSGHKSGTAFCLAEEHAGEIFNI
jgi:hypothetical protein